MIPTLSSLIATITPANALSNILQIANGLGLSTTSWGPFGVVMTMLETMAQVVSQQSVDVSLIAQGGYVTTAAAMTDSNGNPITTWLDLVASEMFNVTRQQAVAASGLVAISNTSTTPRGPFAVGTVHIQHPTTGATYSNSVAGEQMYGSAIAGTPFYSTMHFAADAAYTGSAGNMVAGVRPVLTTPYPGCSCVALGTYGSSSALVGTDAATNDAVLAACQAKLGAIAPNGAPGALVSVATTPAIVAAYGTVSAIITRARKSLNTSNGAVYLYIANANGPALSSDAAIVQLAEQALAVPTGMSLTVQPALTQLILVQAYIYCDGTPNNFATLAANAVEAYFASLPIGGTNLAVTGVVPISGILAAIQNALTSSVTGINLGSPLVNVTMSSPYVVPVLHPASFFVVTQVPVPT
jgi:hypothetical protein